MVGCKDDPSHKLRNLPSLQQSPTQQHERDTRVAHWLHTLSRTHSTSPHTISPALSKAQDHQSPDPLPTARHSPSKPIHPNPLANARSKKRKALADLEPSQPRKSARLRQKQTVSGHNMSTSPSQKKMAGKYTRRERARRGPEGDEGTAGVGHIVTRSRTQAKVPTASSSGKENRDIMRDAATTSLGYEDAESTTPLLQPVAGLVPPDLGSPPKRKLPSSRPPSPTKSTSTKGSKPPAQVDKRERLSLLNPPVKFFSANYLSSLGKPIPPLVKSLWVEYIVPEDNGYIPQAFKVRRPSLALVSVLTVHQGKNASADPKQVETKHTPILFCKQYSIYQRRL